MAPAAPAWWAAPAPTGGRRSPAAACAAPAGSPAGPARTASTSTGSRWFRGLPGRIPPHWRDQRRTPRRRTGASQSKRPCEQARSGKKRSPAPRNVATSSRSSNELRRCAGSAYQYPHTAWVVSTSLGNWQSILLTMKTNHQLAHLFAGCLQQVAEQRHLLRPLLQARLFLPLLLPPTVLLRVPGALLLHDVLPAGVPEAKGRRSGLTIKD